MSTGPGRQAVSAKATALDVATCSGAVPAKVFIFIVGALITKTQFDSSGRALYMFMSMIHTVVPL